jgi:hypothetical protein
MDTVCDSVFSNIVLSRHNPVGEGDEDVCAGEGEKECECDGGGEGAGN